VGLARSRADGYSLGAGGLGAAPKVFASRRFQVQHDDSLRTLEKTRTYLRDFIRLDEQATSARELYDGMLALCPDRANPGSLWGAAVAAEAPNFV
jgi:hypothetical protein